MSNLAGFGLRFCTIKTDKKTLGVSWTLKPPAPFLWISKEIEMWIVSLDVLAGKAIDPLPNLK